ncbi:tRNA glutamyl-Q(34) synthetase GluQRS [Marinobacter sp.]|uniref:tRNA glutamyl-Q(34) synthetase GluQRS n=1 Tax=Marinobacter sp. TaxID=50741 RepID=UPI0034A454AD
MTERSYRGRFAPSPTGPLHFGSLVTAVASYAEAKSRQGQWLVRIEDLDPLRENPEASDHILHSLTCHGLTPDEPVRFQSQRHSAYQHAIDQLLKTQQAYRCACSRKQLQAHQGRHPERCREGECQPGKRPFAIRFALQDERCHWQDDLLGAQGQQVRAETDDPVILRKEAFYAYQLAVVVDDINQRITDVVRGSDLLEMTAQQQQIYRALGAAPPRWIHIPVILNEQGQKLSKQNHAPALDDQQPASNLIQALQALGQQPPARLQRFSVGDILKWAAEHWRREAIPLTSR